MQRPLAAALAAACLAAAGPAAAQFQKPEDAVRYRQAAFQVMAAHFGRIGAMVNNRIPFDAAQAAANAEIATYMSKLPYAGFVEGSQANSKARPEIWTERAKFDAAAQKMQDDMSRLNAAAKTGNLDQIRAAFGATAQSCKACHDAYQAK